MRRSAVTFVAAVLMALPAAAQRLAFDAISIKPARSGGPGNGRLEISPTGDLTAIGVPVFVLLHYAYRLPGNPSPLFPDPLPDWTLQEKYDIQAKAPADAIPRGLGDSEAKNRIEQMMRALLADRLRLVMRIAQKTMPVYALTVASGGPKIEKSAIAQSDCKFHTAPEGCHTFVIGLGHPLNAKAVDMDDLAHYISNWTDRPVVNRTALSGLFTLNTEGWVPMRLPPPPPNAVPNGNPFAGLPTIFAVLAKLGLELEPGEATLAVYKVQHIERPVVN